MDRSALTAIIAPVVAPLGLEVDDVDVLKAGGRRLVRVRLDGDGPRGIGPDMDQIAGASKIISEALDSADMGQQPYVLEVSSRGVDTPLTRPVHFRRNRGRLVSARLRDGSSLTGRITAADDQTVTIEVDGGTTRQIGLGDVAKTVVQVEFNRPDDDEEA